MSTAKYTTVSDEDAITIVQNAVVTEHSQRRFRDRRVTLGLVVAFFFFVACMLCAEHHHNNDTNGRSPHLKGRNDDASADNDNNDDTWGWINNFCNEREWCTTGRQWFGHLVGVRPETTDPPSSGVVQPTYNSYDSMKIMDDEDDDDDDAYADDDGTDAYTIDDDDNNDDDDIVEDDDGDDVVADEDDDDDGKYDDDDSYDSDP